MSKEEMRSDLVVKGNQLINASYSLDLVELRIIAICAALAREVKEDLTSDTEFVISAADYSKSFGVDIDTAYAALSNAARSLVDRSFTFNEENKKTRTKGRVKSNWVSRCYYSVDGSPVITVSFTRDVVNFVGVLSEHFSSYSLEYIAKLSSKYAFRVYELLICWRNTNGNVPVISYADLRGKLDIQEHEYKTMCSFKTKVLDFALKQINEHTDITVSYTQEKQGRVITGFKFEFKEKKKVARKVKNTTDKPKRLGKFGRSYEEISAFQKDHGISDFDVAAEKLLEYLNNQHN